MLSEVKSICVTINSGSELIDYSSCRERVLKNAALPEVPAIKPMITKLTGWESEGEVFGRMARGD